MNKLVLIIVGTFLVVGLIAGYQYQVQSKEGWEYSGNTGQVQRTTD